MARGQFRSGPESVEIIVANNSSTDSTAEVAARGGCRVVDVEKRCIAAARNGGAAVAVGELLCFVDADMIIHPETFNNVSAIMEHGGYMGGGTGLDLERYSAGILISYYSILIPLRLTGLDGGVWFCRRSDFEQLGGYDESWQMSEDVRFLYALKRLGKQRRPKQRLANRTTIRRLGLPRSFAIASCRKFDRFGEWHMFTLMIKSLVWSIFSRKHLQQFVDSYWYRDRE